MTARNTELYATPLVWRYSSLEMQAQFGDDKKFGLWRRLWLELARAQQKLGLAITDAQIAEMEAHLADIDYDLAGKIERANRHDVMAHVETFGAVCPLAKPIIHLGATSCYVTDNTDLIIMREALQNTCNSLARVIDRMAKFVGQYADVPTLGYTHLQPAQPTTVGKRAANWLQDLVLDLQALEELLPKIRFLGAKGATGTQDSFMKLFGGDEGKVQRLDYLVAVAFEFPRRFAVTGQTYTRKLDAMILSALGGLAASVHKICLDLRMLQHMKEIEEPFEKGQIGSSAMAYKRNPMRCERGNSLARHAMTLPSEAIMTHAFQVLERTLDDSACRRIYIPEAFLSIDAILLIMQNVFEGTVVYPAVIQRNLLAELPFLATETLIMDMVEKHGADRQVCHGKIRDHSGEAGKRVKTGDGVNDLLARIVGDAYFAPMGSAELQALFTDPALFIGRAPAQAREFLDIEVWPILIKYREVLDGSAELRV